MAGRLAPLLIPAFSVDADEHLTAAFLGMMNVSVIAERGFKSHVVSGICSVVSGAR